MTIWIMVQGFMIVTGRSQDGIKGFIFNAFRSYLIVAVATGLAAGSAFSVRTLTETLTSSVAQVVTGDTAAAKCLEADSAFLGCKVDRNLQVMQAAMNFVGQLDTADDPVLEDKKARAGWFVGIGTAGPALVTGTMLLLYKVMMAMFIGFGPIFILALLFKRTAPLFQKWLYYGIATIFSSMVLAVMSDISMDLVENVAGSLFVADLLGVKTAGMMQAATQQLGLGLLLSTLLLSVPPMAGNFFNGLMGSFSSQQNALGSMSGSAMSAHNGAGQTGLAGAQGIGGKGTQGADGRTGGGSTISGGNGSAGSAAPQLGGRVSMGQSSTLGNSDTVKPAGSSVMGHSSALSPAGTTMAGSNAEPPKSAAQARQAANEAYADQAASNSTGSWGTSQMVAPPSNASPETQRIAQQNAIAHNGGSLGGSTAPTASALPSQALSGSKVGTSTDVMKSKT